MGEERQHSPLNDLWEVHRAVFGTVGSEPDVYADYDRCVELGRKHRQAIEALAPSPTEGGVEALIADAIGRTIWPRSGKSVRDKLSAKAAQAVMAALSVRGAGE